MPQNPASNKFSSFIGISLLIAVIGFTVFINFKAKKEVADLTEIEAEIEFEPFTEYDLANFWRLENLQTDSINIDYEKQITHIKINKNLGNKQQSSLIKRSFYNKMSDSTKKYFEEAYNEYFPKGFIVNYGKLAFKNAEYNSAKDGVTFEDVEISDLNYFHADTSKLLEIAGLFMEYQIKSISTELVYGDFTRISFKDGREIFLVKQNAEIAADYKRFLENAESLNDSTKMILPY